MSSYHPFEIAATYTHVLTDNTYVNTPTLLMKSLLGGPQVGFRLYSFQPFVRGLFGVSHTARATPFAIAAGGGISMDITDHLALRLLQMDYYRLHGGGAPDGADYLRIGFGIAYEFGSR